MIAGMREMLRKAGMMSEEKIAALGDGEIFNIVHGFAMTAAWQAIKETDKDKAAMMWRPGPDVVADMENEMTKTLAKCFDIAKSRQEEICDVMNIFTCRREKIISTLNDAIERLGHEHFLEHDVGGVHTSVIKDYRMRLAVDILICTKLLEENEV